MVRPVSLRCTTRTVVITSSQPGQPTTSSALQWVHGPRTVVISISMRMSPLSTRLQWVHGPRTVVIAADVETYYEIYRASMGPRSENRGYSRMWYILVRIHAQASMGPRSENRGYSRCSASSISKRGSFNGSTVREPWLLRAGSADRGPGAEASMGPRSENRGYCAAGFDWTGEFAIALQWVHGPRTVVIKTGAVEP